MDDSPTTYLVAYTAGWGDEGRWRRMAFAFHAALKEATGKVPASLMGSASHDSASFIIDSAADAQAVYGAIRKRLPEGLFEFHSINPDRLFVVEITRNAVASEAVIHTLLGMRGR